MDNDQAWKEIKIKFVMGRCGIDRTSAIEYLEADEWIADDAVTTYKSDIAFAEEQYYALRKLCIRAI